MSITDFVNNSLEGNAFGVKTSLDSVLKDKIAGALDVKKKEIAHSLVGIKD